MENTEELWTAEVILNSNTNLPHPVINIRLLASNCFKADRRKRANLALDESTVSIAISPTSLVTENGDVKRCPVENSEARKLIRSAGLITTHNFREHENTSTSV